MNIRKATIKDAYGVAKVHVDAWKTTYKHIVPESYLQQMTYKRLEQNWRDLIPQQHVYVAETHDGDIVGFSCGGRERTGNYPEYEGELYAIYILEAYQRKGVGRLLVKPVIKDLMSNRIYSMVVLVLEENSSRLFYESLGAKKIDTVEIEIAGKKLKERVYGWEDITS